MPAQAEVLPVDADLALQDELGDLRSYRHRGWLLDLGLNLTRDVAVCQVAGDVQVPIAARADIAAAKPDLGTTSAWRNSAERVELSRSGGPVSMLPA